MFWSSEGVGGMMRESFGEWFLPAASPLVSKVG